MTARYSVVILLVIGCKDEPINHVDECPSCTSMMEINGANWPSKPGYAKFEINESKDTSFILEINETSPIHDTYSDNIFFIDIPFELGEYRLDTHLNSEWGTDVNFNIYEFEYGTATQFYEPLLDVSNTITVDSIDRNNGYFKIYFNLTLYPNRDPNGEVHNSTYPAKIQLQGYAEGTITL